MSRDTFKAKGEGEADAAEAHWENECMDNPVVREQVRRQNQLKSLIFQMKAMPAEDVDECIRAWKEEMDERYEYGVCLDEEVDEDE